jgi:hypothetical protein
LAPISFSQPSQLRLSLSKAFWTLPAIEPQELEPVLWAAAFLVAGSLVGAFSRTCSYTRRHH